MKSRPWNSRSPGNIEKAREGDAAGGGRKLDVGKAPMQQGFVEYFPLAAFAVAMVSEYGHRKYETGDVYSGNCRRVPQGDVRYGDAKARHMFKIPIEGQYDEGDSGLAHKAQEAWNIMMELETMIKLGKLEIRRGNDIVDGKPVLGTARAVKI